MSDASDPTGAPPSEGTQEQKRVERDKVPGAKRSTSVLPTLLFWVGALTFGTAVAVSNHDLADMALALLPIVLIAAFAVFGVATWLRKR